jgi:hypothetical protein
VEGLSEVAQKLTRWAEAEEDEPGANRVAVLRWDRGVSAGHFVSHNRQISASDTPASSGTFCTLSFPEIKILSPRCSE